jgi:hypothetical protein
MTKEFHNEDSKPLTAAEPGAVYTATPRMEMPASSSPFLRIASDEELAQCITLEQLHEELSEMIHRHYHPES